MLVYIVARGHPSKLSPLNGIFEWDQAVALKKQGVDVVYLAIDYRSFRRKRKLGRVSLDDQDIHVEEYNIPLNGICRGSLWTKLACHYLSKLYEDCVKKYGSPDIIHSHFFRYSHLTATVLRSKKIPLIATEHFSRVHEDRLTKYEYKLAISTYKYFDAVVAVSNSLATSLREKFQVESIIIPNMVDTERYNKNVNSNRISRKMVSVGRLIAGKRMDLLIEAFEKVHEQYNDAKLVIFGDGDQRTILENMVTKKSLDDAITFKGVCDRSVIAEEFSNSDFFVLASERETFGVVFIEAMVAGLPVLGTICGGPETFITQKQGILVESGDLNKLITAMQTMCANTNHYDRDEIRDFAEQQFGAQGVAEKIIDIYSNIIYKK